LFLESKPTTTAITVGWIVTSIVFAVVLSGLVIVLLIRRSYRFRNLNAGAPSIISAPNESYSFRNGLLNERLNDTLSTYDNSLEVPQTNMHSVCFRTSVKAECPKTTE
jgi:hypothetical protein